MDRRYRRRRHLLRPRINFFQLPDHRFEDKFRLCKDSVNMLLGKIAQNLRYVDQRYFDINESNP